MTTQSPSEGVRRLSVFAGGLGAVLFFAWIFVQSGAFTEIDADEWPLAAAFIVGGLLVSFFAPWALVRAAAWVARGFSGGRNRPD